METDKEGRGMYQMARPENPPASGPTNPSDEIAAMRSSFRALRGAKPQPIDLATWYARVKLNSDGGATAPVQSRKAA